jgi:FMN reductase
MAPGPVIVGLGGSTSAVSTTNRLLQQCLAILEQRGARVSTFASAELARLPIYAASGSEREVPEAAGLVAAVRAADCVVLATPGYHGAMSGLVKNALDHLECLREDRPPYLDGRAVGIIVAASGWQACGTTLVSARSAVHALRGWPTPFGVSVNSAEQRPDAEGHFDERVTGALHILADQLLAFAGWRAAARASAR